ncbi:hypothetical protein Ahy_A07g034918 [Arachis hypogaea]|uniref:Uncharacterized protein n=1 Tax=Arachis hypogaea TaxID=3818 RepID=A0A445CD10_ARAHY|nr:hypothetical protein Ahy_A07g034918 [Arachis hypogaea]
MFQIIVETHDLRCSTRLIARVFAELSEKKKVIVEEMGFGVLRHIPELNVSHKLLRGLILCFDLYHRFLDTRNGKIYITLPSKLNEQQKEIVDSFKDATLASLTKSMMDMSIKREENLLKFKTTSSSSSRKASCYRQL